MKSSTWKTLPNKSKHQLMEGCGLNSTQWSVATYSTAIRFSVDEELAVGTTSILLEKNYVSPCHNIHRYSHTGGHIIYSWQTVYMCVCVCVCSQQWKENYSCWQILNLTWTVTLSSSSPCRERQTGWQAARACQRLLFSEHSQELTKL